MKIRGLPHKRRSFFARSSDENAVLARAFEERRDNLRNSQNVFFIVARQAKECPVGFYLEIYYEN